MPARHKKLVSSIEELKKANPKIGVGCFRMPLDESIAIFNAVGVPMQFKPKSAEDMKKINSQVKRFNYPASLHLPNLRYEDNGKMIMKAELIAILKHKTPKNINIVTVHLGWKDADLVLDKKGNWLDNKIANNVKKGLFDIFAAGIRSGKIMTIENLHYKPYKHQFRELLSSKTEHLVNTRNLIAKEVAKKTGKTFRQVLKMTGYTLDTGHASSNAHLNKKYPLSAWLKTLGKDIKVIHIHDMARQMFEGRKIEMAHNIVGKGTIDWRKFFRLKKRYCPDAPMILELPEEDAIKSISYLCRK